MFKKSFAVVSALLFATDTANAAIIQHGTYFTDTTNGLEWLNNTPLAGLSYNTVLNGFGGYTTAGWRFATGAELKSFVTSYVGVPALPDPNDWRYVFNNTADAYYSAYSLSQLLGVNVNFGVPGIPATSYYYHSGYVPTDGEFSGIATQAYYDNGEGRAAVFLLGAYRNFVSPFPLTGVIQLYPNFAVKEYATGINVSSVLVRDIPAPARTVAEPATYSLLLAGLGLLALKRRKVP